ncbi:MAG: WYL domain-containing protein [Clostridiales bacterium]|nr:WYL domain-containing protein [Clostridiales bacterium]
MSYIPDAKSSRLLVFYHRLTNGEILGKAELAQEFGVTQRSIQRDMESLRCFLAEQGKSESVFYDREKKGYRLSGSPSSRMSNSEIFAVCKILLESRSLCKEEMMPILEKLVACCVPEENLRTVERLLNNEKFHYIEPHHGQPILETMWELGQAVQSQLVVEIQYERMKDPTLVTRRVQPVGIMFSEYYFYLTAFIEDIDRESHFEHADDLFPTIYRIDRIRAFQVTEDHFRIPYRDRFEEGEFRKRVQFMYGGTLRTVRFTYSGPSIEAVLDRLPTAEILGEKDGVYTVQAEVFGKGIDMWLRSQGEYVSIDV